MQVLHCVTFMKISNAVYNNAFPHHSDRGRRCGYRRNGSPTACSIVPGLLGHRQEPVDLKDVVFVEGA